MSNSRVSSPTLMSAVTDVISRSVSTTVGATNDMISVLSNNQSSTTFTIPTTKPINSNTTNGTVITTTPSPSPRPEHLLWVLPVMVGLVFFLVLLALVLFYTVKSVELCIMRMCYKYCGLCEPKSQRREEYRHLNDEFDPDNFSMDELRLRDAR